MCKLLRHTLLTLAFTPVVALPFTLGFSVTNIADNLLHLLEKFSPTNLYNTLVLKINSIKNLISNNSFLKEIHTNITTISNQPKPLEDLAQEVDNYLTFVMNSIKIEEAHQ